MNNIMKRLPRYYRKSLIMWGITNGIQAELAECERTAEKFDKELCVSTAEDNLKRWENDLQLTTPPIGNDYAAWLNIRRGNILAKMRGDGACTKSMLESVAESYTDGKVTVDESYYNEYTIMLMFHKIGVPTRLNEIIAAVSEIKPAHMLLKYKVKYRTWQDVLNNTAFWADLLPFTWQDILDEEDILDG